MKDENITPQDHTDHGDYFVEYRETDAAIALRKGYKDRVYFGRYTQSDEKEIPDQWAEVPLSLQDHAWIAPMVQYLNSLTEHNSMCRQNREAFEVLLAVFKKDPNLQIVTLGRKVKNYLVKEYEGTSGQRAYKLNTSVRKLIRDYAKATKNAEHRVLINELTGQRKNDWKKWPQINPGDSKPRSSLACVYGKMTGKNNAELLKAFTEFNLGYATTWARIRKNLQEHHPELHARILAFIDWHGIEEVTFLEKGSNYVRNVQKQTGLSEQQKINQLDLVRLQFDLLHALNDPWLTGLAYSKILDQKHFYRIWNFKYEGVLSLENYLDYFSDEKGHIVTQRSVGISGKRRNLELKVPIRLQDFVTPTMGETLCMKWMLGMNRVPPTATRITHDQLNWDHKHYVFSDVFKGRNNQIHTLHILKNSSDGRLITAYSAIQNMGGQGSNDPTFLPSLEKLKYKLQGVYDFDPFLLDETQLTDFDLGLKGVSNDTISTLRTVFRHVQSAPDNSLVITQFSQAVVNVEEAKRGNATLSDNMDMTHDIEDPDEESAKARRQFHTAQTRETVYRARSSDKVLKKLGEDFGIEVNNAIGAKVADILEAKRTANAGADGALEFSELRAAIGMTGVELEASPDALLLQADAEKWVMEDSGIWIKDGRVAFIDDPFTAFSIKEKMGQIEGQNGEKIRQVFESRGKEKAASILAEYILLERIYERLSPESKKAAQQPLFEKMKGKLPLNLIVDGGVL